MTDTQPGSETNTSDWNRQASTFDWEGWIAEENAADAERAKAKAAEVPAEASAPAVAPPSFPPPTGQPMAVPPAAAYPPPVGLTDSFTPAPAAHTSYGWSSPDGHPMPMGYAQPSVGYGTNFVVPTSRPTDTVSVLALIFGILPTVPLGLIFGIIGVVRTSNPIRKGRWMAVTGLIGALAWIAISVLLPVYLHSRDAPRDSTGQVTSAATASVYKLRKGDCFSQNFAAASSQVASVTLVPCSQLHNTTVFATVAMSGSWTSNDDMVARGSKACVPALKAFYQGIPNVNPQIKFGAIVPDHVVWDTGNHTARCVLSDPVKQFTGDIRSD